MKRTNRIHWIRPILENRNDPRITSFKFRESDGTIRDYFWFKEKAFVVILEEVSPEYILITAFCIDQNNYKYYENKARKAMAHFQRVSLLHTGGNLFSGLILAKKGMIITRIMCSAGKILLI